MPAARRRTRPADRAATLLAIAEELFGKHGYRAVSVHDIAAAAGISGPAIYRHFSSKQDLFARVLADGLGAMHSATETALAEHPRAGKPRLRAVTESLAELSLRRRDASSLWRWNATELSQRERFALTKRGNELITSWAEVLREDRADIDADQAKVACLGGLAVLSSVAVHRVTLPKRRFVTLLADTASAVLMAPVPARQATPRAPVDVAEGRREQILAAATRLFADRGYHAVSMEDIGRAVGLAAPSVYRHFTGKGEILTTAATRMGAQLMGEAAEALATQGEPAEALRAVIASYVDKLIQFSDLATVYSREVYQLPAGQRDELVKVQRDYVAVWVDLLCKAFPERGAAEARVIAHAGLTVVNDLSRTGWTRRRPTHRAESIALCAAALGV